ncbi:MAG: hypothetical protein LIP09_01370 [Bacteroidales bacterium]|nr:hypothetical protein [Bacteroidales bacterium]
MSKTYHYTEDDYEQNKAAAIDEALRKVHELNSRPLLEANIQLTEWMQNGIDVTYKDPKGLLKSDHIRLIDFSQTENNTFHAINQWTVVNGKTPKRADIVVFLNGLPISVIELKSPSREITNSEEAHQQLLNYMLLQPTRNSKPRWHDARNA